MALSCGLKLDENGPNFDEKWYQNERKTTSLFVSLSVWYTTLLRIEGVIPDGSIYEAGKACFKTTQLLQDGP